MYILLVHLTLFLTVRGGGGGDFKEKGQGLRTLIPRNSGNFRE
jgi:hypothetical protein